MTDATPIPEALLADFERMLLDRRATLLERLRAEGEELDLVRGARAESADDEHDPEGSTLSSDWSRISGLRDATRSRLAAVDSALDRMAGGVYGRCLRCGRQISPERLEARPEAEHCIDCARALG